MTLHVVAVRDIKANAFMNPFFSAAVGLAVRSFGDEVSADPDKSPLARHPGDYELYTLGTWDPVSARFDLLPAPKQISVGSDFVKSA